MKVDCAIVGGGIVGLSVAMHLGECQPGLRLVLLEKESELATHQTGRNSGVIHSGIYYKPGSLKARFARQGNRSMVAFCRKHGIAVDVCGKVIVATRPSELPLLQNLYQRGLANELEVERISAAAVRDIEPHVRCLEGLACSFNCHRRLQTSSAKYAELILKQGGVIRTSTEVRRIHRRVGGHTLETSNGDVETRFLINCGGLQSDRIARRAGMPLSAEIIPFRGEYYELIPERRFLVKSLIYPVPDPTFPFLGVHFTRMIDGSVHAGPNAVLALQREGYRKSAWKLADCLEMASYRGLWHLGRKYYREALTELHRSLSKATFVESLQQLVPEVKKCDLIPAKAGVRAQAVKPDGTLVDDFLLLSGENSIHVCNAPSPAATASLEIGNAVAQQVPDLRRQPIGYARSKLQR